MITLTSFQLKWLERLILYHINEDNNVQAKLSASQYGLRAGIFTQTALHKFVRREKHIDLLDKSRVSCKSELTE